MLDNIKLTPDQVRGLSPEDKKTLLKMGIEFPLKKDLEPKFTSNLIKQRVCNECGYIEEMWFLVDKTCPQLHELKPVKDNHFPRGSCKVERKTRKICDKCPSFIEGMGIAEAKERLERAYKTIWHLQNFVDKTKANIYV